MDGNKESGVNIGQEEETGTKWIVAWRFVGVCLGSETKENRKMWRKEEVLPRRA